MVTALAQANSLRASSMSEEIEARSKAIGRSSFSDTSSFHPLDEP